MIRVGRGQYSVGAQRSNNFASAVLNLHSINVVMVMVLRRSVFEV